MKCDYVEFMTTSRHNAAESWDFLFFVALNCFMKYVHQMSPPGSDHRLHDQSVRFWYIVTFFP